ncbi:short-chain dehydrogenase [Falsiruegeria mediterranea]|nr:short-chain dehydrogenase [Falsiruegeria mediterranea]
MNAGGTGGRTPNNLTSAGVTNIFATNVLGHVVLVDALLERQLVASTVLYAGSEAARGIPKMGMQRPICPKLWWRNSDQLPMAANSAPRVIRCRPMAMPSWWRPCGWARWRASTHTSVCHHKPGGTAETAGIDHLPLVKRIIFKHVGGVLMPLFGMMNSVEAGAKRYLDGLLNPEFKTGHFYVGKAGYPTGPVVDQASIDATLSNTAAKDNANQALRQLA